MLLLQASLFPVLSPKALSPPIQSLKVYQRLALPPQYTTGEATSSHPAITKEEEEKEEEVVEVSDSEDKFEVFNQPLPLEASTGDLSHPFPIQSSHNQKVISILDDIGI